MNTSHTPLHELPADRFARRVTARLTEGASELPYDISERLRAARMQALARRKKTIAVVHTAPVLVQAGHSATLGRGDSGINWWQSLLSAVPIMALLAGLVVINLDLDEIGMMEVAELDAALLAWIRPVPEIRRHAKPLTPVLALHARTRKHTKPFPQPNASHRAGVGVARGLGGGCLGSGATGAHGARHDHHSPSDSTRLRPGSP